MKGISTEYDNLDNFKSRGSTGFDFGASGKVPDYDGLAVIGEKGGFCIKWPIGVSEQNLLFCPTMQVVHLKKTLHSHHF